NEGDAREYDGYSEETEVAETPLDPDVFPNAAELQSEDTIGGLENVSSTGDFDGDGDFEGIYIPGGRSFSIFSADGALIFESGSLLERITAAAYPEHFNAAADDHGLDDRSDNKGPEPEGVAIGVIDGVTYAFIGLEQIGGVVVVDISEPSAPVFVTYVNNRDFSGDIEAGEAGDLGPEGLEFIPADVSPNGMNLLVVANEVSGSTTIYQITPGM
ncbi:MAG: hypothetical protein NZM00_00855, partial [Anaerolinea sp.]|nr:hypothetical protein [Anaerolinea sp.]